MSSTGDRGIHDLGLMIISDLKATSMSPAPAGMRKALNLS